MLRNKGVPSPEYKFEPMYPTEELIDELIDAPYNEFLKKLNRAIRSAKSADFMIGHAYFMPPINIKNVLNEKVIPLLNEYFYNQHDNPVYNLLKPLEGDLGGLIVEKDDYIGTRITSSNDH